MVDLPSSFSEYVPEPPLEQSGGYTMYKPGNYIVQAIEAKKREFDHTDPRSHSNWELNVTFEFLEGEYQTKKTFHTFVLQSNSPGQMKVGNQQLANMIAATGHVGPCKTFDDTTVMFKPIKIVMKAFPAGTKEPGKNGKPDYVYQKDTNKIAGFYSATSQPPAQRQQPAYQAPPQQPQAPSGVMPQSGPPKAGVPSWLARK